MYEIEIGNMTLSLNNNRFFLFSEKDFAVSNLRDVSYLSICIVSIKEALEANRLFLKYSES